MEHSAARRAKNTSVRSEASTAASARSAASTSPSPTRAPDARMTAASRATWPERWSPMAETESVATSPRVRDRALVPASAARARRATFSRAFSAISAWPEAMRGSSGTLEDPVAAHAVDVLADLQRDPERVVQGGGAVQREQRPRPRDRLPHAGQLVELALTQPGDRGATRAATSSGTPGRRVRTISASRSGVG